jgi:hypothetical protein
MEGRAMPDGFYAILVLVILLLAIGGIASSRSRARRAMHRAHGIAPTPEARPDEQETAPAAPNEGILGKSP